jgi:hypothetical protein
MQINSETQKKVIRNINLITIKTILGQVAITMSCFIFAFSVCCVLSYFNFNEYKKHTMKMNHSIVMQSVSNLQQIADEYENERVVQLQKMKAYADSMMIFRNIARVQLRTKYEVLEQRFNTRDGLDYGEGFEKVQMNILSNGKIWGDIIIIYVDIDKKMQAQIFYRAGIAAVVIGFMVSLVSDTVLRRYNQML